MQEKQKQCREARTDCSELSDTEIACSKCEFTNERTLEQIYNEQFLECVLEGFMMPKLGELMDSAQTEKEIKNPFKKNYTVMESIIGAMTSENMPSILAFVEKHK